MQHATPLTEADHHRLQRLVDRWGMSSILQALACIHQDATSLGTEVQREIDEVQREIDRFYRSQGAYQEP